MKNIRFPAALFFFAASLSLAWSLYFESAILATPYQIGYREGSQMVITAMMLNGENYSDFENQPLAYTAYGIGYNAAALPFALLFGNTLFVHRCVTFIFIVLSAVTGFWIVFHRRRNHSLSLICSAFLMTAFMGWGGIGSAPTGMGTFFFLTALYVPYVLNFDNKSMFVSALFSLIAFHTKAYFVLSFGIVATYVFAFVSKRKAVGYGLLFLALFTAAFALMRINYPFYFVNMIFGNVGNTFRTFKHLSTQLFWLTVYFFPLLTLAAVMLWKEPRKDKELPSDFKTPGFQYDLLNLNKPLVDAKPDYLLHAFVLCLLVFATVLGSHVGNYLAYSYELVVPTFLFWFFINFDRKRTFTLLSTFVVVVNLFYWQFITLHPNMLDQRNSAAWERAFSYLNPSLNILNSPTVASRMVELGMRPVDSGQTDAFYLMKPYPDNPLWGPAYEEHRRDGLEYTQSINEAIAKQEYDLIITTKDVDVFYDLELIAEHYALTDTLVLYMQQTEQKWAVQVWEPR
ncbi:hypothetical protein FBQ83_02220 [Chloroflexi bacterium CFX5]|nr:hypothetical protein [Chloroflexi bacterium CFX5]